MTRVVNIRKEQCDVYIGRAGHGEDGYFGNPYNGRSMRENIDSFRIYFYGRINSVPEFKRRVLELRGKRLGCFCKPASCHGDVIVEYLDREPV